MTQKMRLIGYVGMLLVLQTVSACCLANPVITVGKGSGILWEGLPFHVEFNGTESETLRMSNGIIAVTDVSSCRYKSTLTTRIAGYEVYLFAINRNIGLAVRSTAFASYILNNGTSETLTGTIGIPETKAQTSNGRVIADSEYFWCLTPDNSESESFFKDGSPYRSWIDGNFAIVADGGQQSGEYRVIPFYAASTTSSGRPQSRVILPGGTVVRVSTLECSVLTPTEVNFGDVKYSGRAGAELARLTYPLTVSCDQSGGRIHANINLQWRAITGTDGVSGHLALRQGGGYITGSIDGVTPIGTCDGPGGITFDNTPLKIGEITDRQYRQNINKQVTWRLCSGGVSLPDGPVDAAAELLVTFN